MKVLINILRISIMIIFNYSTVYAQSCGIPDVLTFGTSQTINSITPYWDPVAGATSYNLQYRIRNTGAPWSSSVSTNTNSYTLTNLTAGANYEFIVQSVCPNETSIFSPSGWFTMPVSGTSALVTRGPYLTVATKNSITIQWKTDINCNSEVAYGTSAGTLNSSVNSNANLKDHSIMLTGLQPNTKYYYSVGVIGTSIQATADNFFYTAPSDNDTLPLRFWVTGDFGNGSSHQKAVRDAFINFNGGQKTNGWLWLGDNAYANGTDQEYQDNVFDIYPSQFKNIPVFPAPGNHDYAQSGYQSTASLGTAFPYFDIFNIPTNSGTEKYYSVNYGNIHFIALDSYGSYNNSTSNMYRWLEGDLNNNTQQWTIVYFHHAPYSKGSHDSDDSDEMVDMRTNIIPLLESNGVDLVLGGHSHVYERSQFIKGHFGKENTFSPSNIIQPGGGPYSKSTRVGDGTIYAVCGVSGEISTTSSGYPHNAMFYSNANAYGSIVLEILGNSLSGSFLTSTGAILDNFTITKPAMITAGIDPEINTNNIGDISIYPNPTNNTFNIQFTDVKEKTISLDIYNVFGQLIYTKSANINLSNKIITLSKKDLPIQSAGVYYVKITGNGDTKTKTIVFE